MADDFAVPDSLLRLADHTDSAARDAVVTEVPGPGPVETVAPPPLPLLFLVAVVTVLPLDAVWRLGTPLKPAFHMGDTGIEALFVVAATVVLALGPLVGLLADRIGHSRAVGASLVVTALGAVAASSAPSLAVLGVAVGAQAAAASCAAVSVIAWITAAYPIGTRGRAIVAYAIGVPVAGTVGVAAVGLLASAVGSWRGGMALAAIAAPLALVVYRLEGDAGTRAGISAAAQRLRRRPSLLGLVSAASTLAFVALGGPVVADLYLEHHWHQNLAQRDHAFFVASLAAFAGVPLGGVLVDRVRSHNSVVGGALIVFGLALALSPALSDLWMVETAWVIAALGVAAAAVATLHAVTSIARPQERAMTLGLVGAWGLAAGGVGATVLLAAVSQADGPRTAILAAGLAAAIAGGATLTADFSRDIDAAAVEERFSHLPAHGAALEARGIDFSYGPRQVLFDAGVRVEEGEVAALLGTNGAGKSTLLRLIAGLDHPTAGTIRLWGDDSTYLEAEQIVDLGVALLAGGKMSFPGLTVMENLRVGGHTLRRNGPALTRAIDEVMEIFPVLADRREQRVATLSGGEQQMLALGRVLMTKPRLLLVDELTLGLAPRVVESLLAIVRRINAAGTTVLLVEQSANLALTLAGHAVFLERGEVRFDGATADLLKRDDLLRPVFLGGG